MFGHEIDENGIKPKKEKVRTSFPERFAETQKLNTFSSKTKKEKKLDVCKDTSTDF